MKECKKNHSNDDDICSCKIQGHSKKKFRNFPSVIRPVSIWSTIDNLDLLRGGICHKMLKKWATAIYSGWN